MTTGSKHMIAVVDDDPGLRIALARLLSAMGYEVQLFASGSEFIHAVATSPVKCLILDINLGDIDGLALARQLDAAGFKRPIVFMTASDDKYLRQQCLEFEGAAFLRKPFSRDELDQTMQRLLNRAARQSMSRIEATQNPID